MNPIGGLEMTPQTLVANPTLARPGFWRRQFSSPATGAQIIFDVIFGIVMPVVCFILDPGIIKGSVYTVFVYGLSALAIPTLGLCLVLGQKVGAWSGPASGVLLAGGMCCFVIGAILLPLSIIGLTVAVIAILGFTPLVTAFVYIRNAIRSFLQSRTQATRSRSVAALALATAVTVAIPAAASWQASRMVASSMEQILRGDETSTNDAIDKLRYLRWCADMDPIVLAYEDETDPARKERLAEAYKEITGQDVEGRLGVLRD